MLSEFIGFALSSCRTGITSPPSRTGVTLQFSHGRLKVNQTSKWKSPKASYTFKRAIRSSRSFCCFRQLLSSSVIVPGNDVISGGTPPVRIIRLAQRDSMTAVGFPSQSLDKPSLLVFPFKFFLISFVTLFFRSLFISE